MNLNIQFWSFLTAQNFTRGSQTHEIDKMRFNRSYFWLNIRAKILFIRVEIQENKVFELKVRLRS